MAPQFLLRIDSERSRGSVGEVENSSVQPRMERLAAMILHFSRVHRGVLKMPAMPVEDRKNVAITRRHYGLLNQNQLCGNRVGGLVNSGTRFLHRFGVHVYAPFGSVVRLVGLVEGTFGDGEGRQAASAFFRCVVGEADVDEVQCGAAAAVTVGVAQLVVVDVDRFVEGVFDGLEVVGRIAFPVVADEAPDVNLAREVCRDAGDGEGEVGEGSFEDSGGGGCVGEAALQDPSALFDARLDLDREAECSSVAVNYEMGEERHEVRVGVGVRREGRRRLRGRRGHVGSFHWRVGG